MRRHGEAPIPRSDSWARTTALAVPYRLDQRGTRMQTLLVLLKPVVEWRPKWLWKSLRSIRRFLFGPLAVLRGGRWSYIPIGDVWKSHIASFRGGPV